MSTGSTGDMMAGLVSLGVGTSLGLIAARLLRRHAPSERPAGDSLADLEERLGQCIAQLRDLDEQRGRLTPDGYASQKADFETRAAQLLRARDALLQTPKKAAVSGRSEAPADLTPTMRFLAQRPQLKGALWGGGTVAVLALLYILVSAEQHPRMEAQAVSMTGGGPMAVDQQADGAELQKLMGEITRDPNNAANLLRMAHILLKNQMLEEARVVNDRAMALQPDNLEGKVHQAVLQAAGGQSEQAIAALGELVRQEPKLAEAWFFRGMLAMQAGMQAEMQESFKQFVVVAPDGPQKERIKAMLQAQGGG